MEAESHKPEDEAGTEFQLADDKINDKTSGVGTIEERPQPPLNPNPGLLTLSWGVFGLGAYFLYWAAGGYTKGSADGAKRAFATMGGILAFPLGIFLRKWAYRGFAKALGVTDFYGGPSE